MSSIPTESRIFADVYLRELRRREAFHANYLAPGTLTWRDAVEQAFDRAMKIGSPIKRVAYVRKLAKYFNDEVSRENFASFLLDHAGNNRAAAMMIATLSAGKHPMAGINESGVNIMRHAIITRRNRGSSWSGRSDMAYVSKHALSRMHERGHDLTTTETTGVLACVGILGLILERSQKHADAGMCLRYEGTLLTGSLKGQLFDVRTALPADEVKNQTLLAQGDAAMAAVNSWLAKRMLSDDKALCETIPFIPRRNDYTLSFCDGNNAGRSSQQITGRPLPSVSF